MTVMPDMSTLAIFGHLRKTRMQALVICLSKYLNNQQAEKQIPYLELWFLTV